MKIEKYALKAMKMLMENGKYMQNTPSAPRELASKSWEIAREMKKFEENSKQK